MDKPSKKNSTLIMAFCFVKVKTIRLYTICLLDDIELMGYPNKERSLKDKPFFMD
jgi:hypothetical protein